MGLSQRQSYRSPAGISIQQRRSFDELLAVSAAFTFERVVCIANRLVIELEQLSQIVPREVTLRVFSSVDDTGR